MLIIGSEPVIKEHVYHVTLKEISKAMHARWPNWIFSYIAFRVKGKSSFLNQLYEIITAVVHCHWQKNVKTQEIAIAPSNLIDVKLCLALIFDLEYGPRNASMMKSDSTNSYNVWTEVNYKSRTLIKKLSVVPS